MILVRMFILYIPLAYLGSWLFDINGIFFAACFSNLAVGVGAYIWNRIACNQQAAKESQQPSLATVE
ncbi:MAG: MATE family efflux transporter, partial [Symploca sp. SIO2D2]|nr:MATE family efflux transporter [Symploca sp. SIO2D2]